mmetsp:Transcript_52159/g.111022  ORF Transcript_52159/g.111022 Transcript_52159/m.111022 type:complete len:1324 (+) Transcript_52159:87-4058(+)
MRATCVFQKQGATAHLLRRVVTQLQLRGPGLDRHVALAAALGLRRYHGGPLPPPPVPSGLTGAPANPLTPPPAASFGSLPSQPSGLHWASNTKKGPSSFAEELFGDDNVLILYSTQRSLLNPTVDEQASTRNGMQQVDISWTLNGQTLHGSGIGSSKRTARRDAARHLLKQVELTDEVLERIRKAVLNALLVRAGATSLEDRMVERSSDGQFRHRITWRIPQEHGASSVEISECATGASPSDAQAHAWEQLYSVVQRMDHFPGAAKQQQQSAKASSKKAAKSPKAAAKAALKPAGEQLSVTAAAEVAVRHNSLVQSMRILAKDIVVSHKSGYHCTLTWQWRDQGGVPQSRTTNGVATSKRAAKAEAQNQMLVTEGFAGDFGVKMLNAAAEVRTKAKDNNSSCIQEACRFAEAWPPETWGYVLNDVVQYALAQNDGMSLATLGGVLSAQLAGHATDPSIGMVPAAWEAVLDSCALVVSEELSSTALKAFDKLPVSSKYFPTLSQRDYFQHFRSSIAWERVGSNQASLNDIRILGLTGMNLEKTNLMLPYINLAPTAQSQMDFDTSVLRTGDIVFLQGVSKSQGAYSPFDCELSGHLAQVTSKTAGKPGSAPKMVVRCCSLTPEDYDCDQYVVHGLNSELTTMRLLEALNKLTQTDQMKKLEVGQVPANFSPVLRTILTESFHGHDTQRAAALAEETHESVDPATIEQRVALATDAAFQRGTPLTPAQALAVRASLERRFTLIHGPPGTGKSTAAACVVLAWKSLGQRILCVADSNVAADNLHDNLEKWGVKACRFTLQESSTSDRRDEQQQQKPKPRMARGLAWRLDATSLCERRKEMQRMLEQSQVIVTTCSSAGNDLLKGMKFEHVVIDECTQSVEPSTLIPLSRGCSHLVLIGDHKQLPPTVLTEEAKRGGLETSLFSRAVRDPHILMHDAHLEPKGDFVKPVFLDLQRRMHPSISAFPNRHFYQGAIADGPGERTTIPGIPWPRNGEIRVLLVDVSSGEQSAGTSYTNPAEVEAVREFTMWLLQGREPKVAPSEVAILTPYLQQRKSLDQALNSISWKQQGSRHSSFGETVDGPKISTIDGFQGAERDLVIFSAVRSNGVGRLGFLSDPRRTNVALTRARRGLIVFADASTLRHSRDSVWASWLSWAEGHDAVMPFEAFRASLGLQPLASRAPAASTTSPFSASSSASSFFSSTPFASTSSSPSAPEPSSSFGFGSGSAAFASSSRSSSETVSPFGQVPQQSAFASSVSSFNQQQQPQTPQSFRQQQQQQQPPGTPMQSAFASPVSPFGQQQHQQHQQDQAQQQPQQPESPFGFGGQRRQ